MTTATLGKRRGGQNRSVEVGDVSVRFLPDKTVVRTACPRTLYDLLQQSVQLGRSVFLYPETKTDLKAAVGNNRLKIVPIVTLIPSGSVFEVRKRGGKGRRVGRNIVGGSAGLDAKKS